MGTSDFKIVCIVDKNKIATAINDMRIDQVLFNKLSDKTPFLFINENLCRASANKENVDWDILLIHYPSNQDQGNNIMGKEIHSYLTKQLPDNTLLMWHMNAQNLIDTNGLNELSIKKWKKGAHISGDTNGYPRLRHLSVSYDEGKNTFDKDKYKNAKIELIKWFDLYEKLNAALDYLHESLGGKPPAIKILTNGDEKLFDLDEKFKKNNEEKKLGEWIEDLENATKDYNETLTNVRDALLKQACTYE